MLKYINRRILKSFIISMSGYFVILALVIVDPESPGDNVFGRILGILIYIAPLLIMLEAVREIMKERERQRNGND